MSLLPAYFGARKRRNEVAPPSPETDEDLHETLFNIIPPQTAEKPRPEHQLQDPLPEQQLQEALQEQRLQEQPLHEPAQEQRLQEPLSEPMEKQPEAVAAGRNVHPVDAMDLRRLSIDNDGRLYWDGKPVEVRRRIMMSRRQVVAASVLGAFVAVGAIGAAIQGTAVAHDWACRFGWTTSYCPEADPKSAPAVLTRPDIPA